MLFKVIFQREQEPLPLKEYYADEHWTEVVIPSFIYEQAFENQQFYALRTTHFYFLFMLRKHVNPRKQRPYDILLVGAYSIVPLSIQEWNKNGDPWQDNNPYVNLFYLDERYQKEFPYDNHCKTSAFLKEFHTLSEASEFLETWKEKVLQDHKKREKNRSI